MTDAREFLVAQALDIAGVCDDVLRPPVAGYDDFIEVGCPVIGTEYRVCSCERQ